MPDAARALVAVPSSGRLVALGSAPVSSRARLAAEAARQKTALIADLERRLEEAEARAERQREALVGLLSLPAQALETLVAWCSPSRRSSGRLARRRSF